MSARVELRREVGRRPAAILAGVLVLGLGAATLLPRLAVEGVRVPLLVATGIAVPLARSDYAGNSP